MNWKDAYERQMETWEWLRSALGKKELHTWANLECQSSPMKYDLYQRLIPAEEGKLLTADPVFVSNEMIDLIEHARKSWRIERFVQSDIFVPHAFVYFERPVYLADRHGKKVNVRAFSYCPVHVEADLDEEFAAQEIQLHDGGLLSVPADKDLPSRGLAVTLYSSLWGDEEDDDAEIFADLRERARAVSHPTNHLTPLHIAPVWFDVDPHEDMDDVDHPGEPTGVDEWWSFLQVVFRLMQQTVAVREKLYPDRHSRRRGIRSGFSPREVLVIRLRRPRHAPTNSERLVEWTHRWVVQGFWRSEWFPSLGIHRQIYIEPYVKGPDDLPLIVKRRAYDWKR